MKVNLNLSVCALDNFLKALVNDNIVNRKYAKVFSKFKDYIEVFYRGC